MGQCNDWSEAADGTYAQCTAEAVSSGLCQAHIDAVDEARQEQAAAINPPPQAIKWTPQNVKATFGAIVNGGRDSSGGQYVGGKADKMHVHVYNDNGAHVKVGNEEYRFLRKPDFIFDLVRWNEGVTAVKAVGDVATIKKLLGAMAIVLAKYGRQSDANFSEYMDALGYDRVER